MKLQNNLLLRNCCHVLLGLCFPPHKDWFYSLNLNADFGLSNTFKYTRNSHTGDITHEIAIVSCHKNRKICLPSRDMLPLGHSRSENYNFSKLEEFRHTFSIFLRVMGYMILYNSFEQSSGLPHLRQNMKHVNFFFV